MDVRGPFHQAQQQVVVLRAFVAGPEATDLAHEPAPNHHEVTGVHAREEMLWRPVRLEEDVAPCALQIELVFVGVDDVGVGVRVEVADDFGQRIRRELVIVIEQRHEVPARQLQGQVRGNRDPAVHRGEADPHALV